MDLKWEVVTLLLIIIINDAASFVGWTTYTNETFKGRTYHVVTAPVVNFADASASCKANGLKLATVRTKAELDFWNVYAIQKNTDKGSSDSTAAWEAWLGGHRHNESEPHSWDDNGQNITMSLFALGQGIVGSRGDQNCISIWTMIGNAPHTLSNPEYKGLADEACTLTIPFICTKHAWGDFSCENKTCGPYPNPDDCSSFFVCGEDKTKVTLDKCDNGLLFNPATFKCDYAQYVTCPGAPFSCANRSCGDYPNPADCGSFFRCEDDKTVVTEYKCDHGLQFDSKSLKCDIPQYVTCAH